MVSITLLGELGKKYGRSHKFEIKSPAEAIRALCANFKGFQKDLIDSSERNVGYRVLVNKKEISESEIRHPVGKQSIKIVPVIMGGKSSWAKVIIGATLIAASFYMPTTALFTVGSASYSWASIAFSIGVSITIGGVSELLASKPKLPGYQESPENTPSNYFNGPVNTTAQGQPVPVGYGTMLVGSAVISAGIDVDQVSA